MPLQAIYIKDDLLSRLKQEENMSKIVDAALRNWYDSSTSIDEKIANIKLMIEKGQSELEPLLELEKKKKQKQDELNEIYENDRAIRKKAAEQKARLSKEYDKYCKDNNIDFRNFTFEQWLRLNK